MLRAVLADLAAAPLIGVSLLADGPDQLFAQAVLDLGGRLEAIAMQPEHSHFDEAPFVALLNQAASVHHVPEHPTPAQAWTAAAEELLCGAGLLIAVWDGSDPRTTAAPPTWLNAPANLASRSVSYGLMARAGADRA